MEDNLRYKQVAVSAITLGSGISMYFAVKKGKTTSKKHPVLKGFVTSMILGSLSSGIIYNTHDVNELEKDLNPLLRTDPNYKSI